MRSQIFATSLTWVVILMTLTRETEGHGRLLEPPSRASGWRLGFEGIPVNYEDNQMYCGGFNVQWNVNHGACGICGDPANGPRPYERPNGVKVSNPLVITDKYTENAVIEASIEITANHLGWVQFLLCKVTSDMPDATQACLAQHVLKDPEGTDKFYIGKMKGVGVYKLQLPPGLTCAHCVFQWKYHTGNSWGTDSEGSGIGHGSQEEFYGCADVSISPKDGPPVTLPPATRPPATPSPTERPTQPPVWPPTQKPTQPPVWPPTQKPTQPPVWPPTQKPTQPPVWPPTPRPTQPPQPTVKPTTDDTDREPTSAREKLLDYLKESYTNNTDYVYWVNGKVVYDGKGEVEPSQQLINLWNHTLPDIHMDAWRKEIRNGHTNMRSYHSSECDICKKNGCNDMTCFGSCPQVCTR